MKTGLQGWTMGKKLQCGAKERKERLKNGEQTAAGRRSVCLQESRSGSLKDIVCLT